MYLVASKIPASHPCIEGEANLAFSLEALPPSWLRASTQTDLVFYLLVGGIALQCHCPCVIKGMA